VSFDRFNEASLRGEVLAIQLRARGQQTQLAVFQSKASFFAPYRLLLYFIVL
jgi:hypothetical protein